jgi:hypothetical protein
MYDDVTEAQLEAILRETSMLEDEAAHAEATHEKMKVRARVRLWQDACVVCVCVCMCVCVCVYVCLRVSHSHRTKIFPDTKKVCRSIM